jgi:hypothetical protein
MSSKEIKIGSLVQAKSIPNPYDMLTGKIGEVTNIFYAGSVQFDGWANKEFILARAAYEVTFPSPIKGTDTWNFTENLLRLIKGPDIDVTETDGLDIGLIV